MGKFNKRILPDIIIIMYRDGISIESNVCATKNMKDKVQIIEFDHKYSNAIYKKVVDWIAIHNNKYTIEFNRYNMLDIGYAMRFNNNRINTIVTVKSLVK